MFTFATNLTFMYADSPFFERIARARASGFRYIEFHNPYPFSEDLEALAAAVNKHGVEVIHFNLPGGNWAAGDRGNASWPDRTDEFQQGVKQTIAIAQKLNCHQLNCPVGYPRPEFSLAAQQQTLVNNLRFAAEETARAGIMLLVEPLNPITHPNYLLTTTAEAVALLERVGHPNLKIQYDYYQMQRSEGELMETVRKTLPHIGYIQLADNPGRHEPGTGEINFRFLLNELAGLDYHRHVGLEYTPRGRTEDSLGWIAEYGLAVDQGVAQ